MTGTRPTSETKIPWRLGEGGPNAGPNMRKLKECIHWICAKATAKDQLGAVKLNKVLFYADMLNYAEAGQPLTGATYVKRQRGPVPREVVLAIDELKTEGRLSVQNVSVFDFVRRDFDASGETDISVFLSSEIDRMDRSMQFVCAQTAEQASDGTHTVVWEAADLGEVLPYDAFFVSYLGDITDDDVKAVQKKMRLIAAEASA